ncbi:MAG: hypothetical protein JXQ87_05710 [Bacteroidia bacterium]
MMFSNYLLTNQKFKKTEFSYDAEYYSNQHLNLDNNSDSTISLAQNGFEISKEIQTILQNENPILQISEDTYKKAKVALKLSEIACFSKSVGSFSRIESIINNCIETNEYEAIE